MPWVSHPRHFLFVHRIAVIFESFEIAGSVMTKNMYSAALAQHAGMKRRHALSIDKIRELKRDFGKGGQFDCPSKTCVFVAGSLGRHDSGEKSDLDLFLTSSAKTAISHLDNIKCLASILGIYKKLDYEQPSNDGEFLKIFNISQHESYVGSARDDGVNWFTVRMLMLLENKPLTDPKLYRKHKAEILKFYFRDRDAGNEFKPLFLMNDLLRFWRTLCLNYENARSKPTRSWKKRNFNLKFSRMLTVFSTVLPIVLQSDVTNEWLLDLTDKTPLERLAGGLDMLNDATFSDQFKSFLDDYEFFLHTKECQDFDQLDEPTKNMLNGKARNISSFLFTALNHPNVSSDYRQYLVI
jgi:hypothetical protein